MTCLKLLLMLLFVIAALRAPAVPNFSIQAGPGDWQLIFSSGFAVSLVYVSYAFSGWNAAIYVAGEIRQPQRTLPLALATSTLFVGLLYLLVNYAFLRVVPSVEMLAIDPFSSDLVGKELAVGFLAGKHLFGDTGAQVVGGLIALCMVSTISAMVMTGPRVLATMAQDFSVLRVLAPKPGKSPVLALGVQWAVVATLLLSASFETVMKYIGITLSLFTCLAVVGLMRLRLKEPNLDRPFRTPLYPLTPIVFLAVNAWMLYFLAQSDPAARNASLLTIAVGVVLYYLMPKSSNNHNHTIESSR